MAEKLSNENELQKKAFEIYYMLGEKRSLRAVAEEIGRTERTVAGWSRRFSWVDRVIQRNIEDSKNRREEQINTQITDVRTKYRIIINNFMAQLSKDVLDGKIKVKNVADFEKLVKLDLLLMGEAVERTEVTGSTELSQADKERLDTIAKLLNSF